jgi:arylsulfatase A-like enzyme
MDILPTIANITSAKIPNDRITDGKDIAPLLFGNPNTQSPYKAFLYYFMNDLCAVRSGKYKLVMKETHKPHRKKPLLYNLDDDIAETKDVAAEHPEIVKNLLAIAQNARQDLGDDSRNIAGQNCRQPGRVKNPKTLLPRTKPE